MANRPSRSGRRSSRHGGPDADDAFVARVYHASYWAQRNPGTLVLLGVVIAAVVGGIYYYVSYRQDLREQAAIQLEEIQQTIGGGDPQVAKLDLTRYLERFGSTPYAGEARLLLADLYLHTDQPEQAVEVLEESDLSIRDPLGAQVGFLRGKAYEAAGRMEAAEQEYLRVADDAEMDFQRIEALAAAARLRENVGEPAAAADLYERVLDELEAGSPDLAYYEMRLAEARARATQS